jgi:protocatechuate 3,4-dioxygenase beta subunit
MQRFKQNLLLLVFIISSLVAVSCQRAVFEENTGAGADSPNAIMLADADEPGQRLTLFGKVVNAENNEPIPDARVYLYQADANGEYLPVDPNDESTAKLSGEVITDAKGEFRVLTIVPREYDQPGNKHIHLHYVRAEGYEETGGVILFNYDVNDEIRQWAIDTGFGTIIDLVDRNGVMEGDVLIELTSE